MTQVNSRSTEKRLTPTSSQRFEIQRKHLLHARRKQGSAFDEMASDFVCDAIWRPNSMGENRKTLANGARWTGNDSGTII